MTTPPKMIKSELISHLELLVRRRTKAGDPHLEKFPGIDNQIGPSRVHEVLEYLQRYPAGTPGHRHADITLALRLRVWLWWEERRLEYALLKQGVASGMFLGQLGGPFGIGKQGISSRIDRLEALLRFDRPDEQLTREARRKSALESVEMDWIHENREQLLSIVDDLEREATRFRLDDDDRAMLDELVQDAVDERNEEVEDGLTPGSMSLLNLAVMEVSTAPAVAELATAPQPHQVHRVLDRANKVRAAFADLGRRSAGEAGRRARSAAPRIRRRRAASARRVGR